MDILNAFVANQGKTELIFEKGKYRPNPRLLPGGGSVYSKLTKDIHKQTVWHPSDQHLHVFNFSVVRSFAYERFVFPNQKVFKNFLSFADLNSRTKRIHTRKNDWGTAFPWISRPTNCKLEMEMEGQDSILDDGTRIGTNLWSRLVKKRDSYCDTGQWVTTAVIL